MMIGVLHIAVSDTGDGWHHVMLRGSVVMSDAMNNRNRKLSVCRRRFVPTDPNRAFATVRQLPLLLAKKQVAIHVDQKFQRNNPVNAIDKWANS